MGQSLVLDLLCISLFVECEMLLHKKWIYFLRSPFSFFVIHFFLLSYILVAVPHHCLNWISDEQAMSKKCWDMSKFISNGNLINPLTDPFEWWLTSVKGIRRVVRSRRRGLWLRGQNNFIISSSHYLAKKIQSFFFIEKYLTPPAFVEVNYEYLAL